ncbi:F-box domain-containing protein [Hypoxylon sp. FL0543]|nr:F-box domain-containing protein [Hypoxylon sp. FL0543]
MSDSPLGPEELLDRLSYRRKDLRKAMINITDPPKPRSVLPDRVSTFGRFDLLPAEIMTMILSVLDTQSIARLAAVSFRGNCVVHSERAYRELVEFAPKALIALKRTGLIRLHSVTTLHDALRTEKCVYCTEFGAFLFLLTCERCCFDCLCSNPWLRVITPKDAELYFALSEDHTKCLPGFCAIPGKYGMKIDHDDRKEAKIDISDYRYDTNDYEHSSDSDSSWGISYKDYGYYNIGIRSMPRHLWLVGVKAARDLGLATHGSEAKMRKASYRRDYDIRFFRARDLLYMEPPVSQGQDLLLRPYDPCIKPDKYFGVASIPFPSLSKSGEIEDGLWCWGCDHTCVIDFSDGLFDYVLKAMVPSTCLPRVVVLGLERRARSKESFLEHIKYCWGAGELIDELAEGIDARL